MDPSGRDVSQVIAGIHRLEGLRPSFRGRADLAVQLEESIIALRRLMGAHPTLRERRR